MPGEAAGSREIDDPAEQPVAVPRQLLLEKLPSRRDVALLVLLEQILLVENHPQVPHAGGDQVPDVLVQHSGRLSEIAIDGAIVEVEDDAFSAEKNRL
jgi:hypothetical protein